ncbi:hypothetical protein [Crocosphaera sp. XPORK-15E]|uniref:hypothetical protein n=1 Tax=Crocosphaera sp. XPORK-15E TaxID=3110247 RepID=UPI002B1F678C|nr:hypothetical protein [Crocosphaera sp. XPORK-15E]MEA5535898.1 hypothetical protein [Crocosphaera sp. XPORK-15E]
MSQTETKQCDVAPKLLCVICPQAQRDWDLDRLFTDLECVLCLQDEYESINKVPAEAWRSAQRRGKKLKSKEKCWLCLLLQGYDVKEIESYLHLTKIGGDVSKGIYKWVSFLAGKKVSDWAQVRLYLECNVTQSYRKNTNTSVNNEELGINIKLHKTPQNQISRSIIVEVFRLLGIDIKEEDIEVIG